MLNPCYKDEEMMQRILSTFCQDKQVMLYNIMTPDAYKHLSSLLRSGHFKRTYDPQRHSYGKGKTPSRQLKEMTNWLLCLFPSSTFSTAQMHQFRHRDYLLFQDHHEEDKGIIAFLDCTPLWDSSWGGEIRILHRGEGMSSFDPVPNTLSLLDARQGTKTAVKYVNHYAGKRWRILVKFLITTR